MMYRWRCSINTLLIIGIVTSLLITTSFWMTCTEDKIKHLDNIYNTDVVMMEDDGDDEDIINDDEDDIRSHMKTDAAAADADADDAAVPYHQIECNINDEYSVKCRQEGNEVFIPFSFINRYFEVYGRMDKDGRDEHFDWQHSYSRIYPPGEKYSPDGVFMSFEHYNVEVRDRVKCISGIDGVPVSTQWGAQGYFYPIQIAQYGLSHYSKMLTENPPVMSIIENAEEGDYVQWITNGNGIVKNVYDDDVNSQVIKFHASESFSLNEVSLTMSSQTSTNFVLSFDVKFVKNGSIAVVLSTNIKSQKRFTVNYVCSDVMLDVRGNDIFYGIGVRSKWTSITRDVLTDFQKGLAHKYLKNKKKASRTVPRGIVRVDFRGSGYVDNVTLSSSNHLSHFYDAANWLLRHQNDRGGWPIMVTRKIADGQLQLPPGWYSAMAQGQAISVLIRAYLRTRRTEYLDAALRSTSIFDIPSSNGGVLAKFLDRFRWYEEYPTTPSSFVLNGFIYSLIGLYDLKMVAPSSQATEAKRLFDEGIVSLKAMLPLFDTGSGSIYDLRHFTLPGMAPNLARWDYHSTHVNQLLLIASIDDDPVFQSVVQRWIGYMTGKRAPHN